MEIGFPKRLELLIERLNLNGNSFAEQIKTPPPVIYNAIGGRESKPSFDVLLKIKQRFPQVDLNWLVSGTGEMMDRSSTTIVQEPEPTFTIIPKSREGIKVHIVTIKAAANALRGIETNEPIEALDELVLPAWMLKKGVHLAIQSKGLSMHPVIHDGAITVIRRIERENWGSFTSGNIHLVYTETYGAQLKYLRRSERNPQFLLMESENAEENPAISVNVEEIFQIWEVDLSLNFKFISQRKQVLERVSQLEMSYFELSLMFNKLKEELKTLPK